MLDLSSMSNLTIKLGGGLRQVVNTICIVFCVCAMLNSAISKLNLKKNRKFRLFVFRSSFT